MTLVETILQDLEESAARTANEANELRAKGEYGSASIMQVWSDAYLQSASIVRSAERSFSNETAEVDYPVNVVEPDWVLQ